MQNLSFRFTRWINWRLKRAGHLFQGHYKAVLVDSDSYLLELIRYCYEISETELKNASQCRNALEARAVAGWLAQKSGCVTLSEVGEVVNPGYMTLETCSAPIFSNKDSEARLNIPNTS